MGDYPSPIPVVEVGARMMGSLGSAPSVNSSVVVCNLPPGTSEALLADHFGKTGLVKVCLSRPSFRFLFFRLWICI